MRNLTSYRKEFHDHHMWNRFYSPSGLFYSVDPLILINLQVSGINPEIYSYVNNNPINNIDLNGLMTSKEKNEQCKTICFAATIIAEAASHTVISMVTGPAAIPCNIGAALLFRKMDHNCKNSCDAKYQEK